VYANTLPMPKGDFFEKGSWAGLADWKSELARHYATARACSAPRPTPASPTATRSSRRSPTSAAAKITSQPTDVAVFFGEPGKRGARPVLRRRGPRAHRLQLLRRVHDRLPRRREEHARSQLPVPRRATRRAHDGGDRGARHVRPGRGAATAATVEIGARGELEARPHTFTADRSSSRAASRHGAALLRMKEDPRGLPRLSPRTGDMVRTNNEALIGIISPGRDDDLSKGVAITSILHTDEVTATSSRCATARAAASSACSSPPTPPGTTCWSGSAAPRLPCSPAAHGWLKAALVRDFAQQSQILLYMRSLEGTLSPAPRPQRTTPAFRRRASSPSCPPARPPPPPSSPRRPTSPSASPRSLGGVPMTMVTETVRASHHGAHPRRRLHRQGRADGVIDEKHRVFGYPGLYVVDG
jgi:cholesterol oxidase